MTPAVLVEGLRWLFWGLVYLFTIVGALMVFAPAGPVLRWVAVVAVLCVIAHDAHGKRGSVKA